MSFVKGFEQSQFRVALKLATNANAINIFDIGIDVAQNELHKYEYLHVHLCACVCIICTRVV